jgi:succinate dehydrogenase/fumarate reductase flavoprotein subunit
MKMQKEKGYLACETDILVVGSEGAGARAAIEAFDKGTRVIIATKGKIGKTGATCIAGADFTVDGKSAKEYCGLTGDERDSPERYFKDIVVEGSYLNNQELVEVHVQEAPIILKEMMDWGLKIYMYESTHFQEMARGAMTHGPLIVRALRKQIMKRKITIIQDIMILDLMLDGTSISGAVGLDMNTGEIIVIHAKAVILATGGFQRAWSFTAAPYELTGDGQAIAFRAGAEMIDMEMVQFVPGIMLWPPRFKSRIFLYNLNVELGQGSLLNSKGERFMGKYDPLRMENSSKELLSIGISKEVAEGRGSPHGGVWWSFKGVNKDRISEAVKTEWLSKWFEKDSKEIVHRILNGEDFEVGAGSHYMIGGIHVNRLGETNIRGLYAAGECKGNLWGATRVASAITEVIIDGKVAGSTAGDYVQACGAHRIDWDHVGSVREKTYNFLEGKGKLSPIRIRKRIQKIADEQVQIIRNGEKLKQGLKELKEMKDVIAKDVGVQGSKTRRYNPEWIEAIQLENLRSCLEMAAASALHRTESRGAQYRTDFEQCDNNNWLKNTIIHQAGDKTNIVSTPIVVTRIQPPAGIMSYQEACGIGLSSIKGREE